MFYLERKKTSVTVGGKSYTIVSEDSTEYVKRVGLYVDRKLQEIEQSTRLPSYASAILTALNIADDLLKAQDENTQLRRNLMKLQKGGRAAERSDNP
ncbi:MAG: cell division protein ZapA [Clostridia bacterium]|nr:cell division protein ZapA [Clostridia bacterium]